MPDYTAHYAETERRLRELLRLAADKVPARAMAEAWGFLAAREYGLCLDEIREHLTEPDRQVAELIDALARSLEMA